MDDVEFEQVVLMQECFNLLWVLKIKVCCLNQLFQADLLLNIEIKQRPKIKTFEISKMKYYDKI